MSATITPLPTPPSRAVPATFSVRADVFLGALPTFQAQANVLASEAEADAATAATAVGLAANQVTLATTQANNAAISASSADVSATAAAAAVNAPVWVSGTTYAIGDTRWSPANYAVYRRKTAGAGTTDPSADVVNWASTVFPEQTNNAGKFVTTDGANASWGVATIDIAYDDRAQLRTMTNFTPSVVVDGIGLFRHLVGSTEPDDDETCFATATGCWLLQCPHNDYITDQLLGGSNPILYSCAINTILAVYTVNIAIQTIPVAGASPSDVVVVSPSSSLGGRLSVYGYVSAPGIVSVCVQNATAATASLPVPAGLWRVAAIPTLGY